MLHGSGSDDDNDDDISDTPKIQFSILFITCWPNSLVGNWRFYLIIYLFIY